MWAKLWKDALSRNVEESQRKFSDQDSDANDVHKNPISSFYAKLLTARQTDRQTQVKHNLFGGRKCNTLV